MTEHPVQFMYTEIELPDIPCSWTGRLIVTMAVLLKLIHRFNIMPIKILDDFFFSEFNRMILKVTGIYKGHRVVKTSLKKKKMKVTYLTYLTKLLTTVWYCHRHTD